MRFIKTYYDNSSSKTVGFQQAFKELVPFYKDIKLLRVTLQQLESGQSMGTMWASYKKV